MPAPTSLQKKPLPFGSPHVAYVLLWYPLFTQPFIFREVEKLRERLPVKVYALYGQNLRHCSREMLTARDRAAHFGLKSLPRVLGEAALATARDPRAISAMARDALLRKWPSVEVLGENLWGFATGLSLGRQFKEDGVDIVYAPWPRGAATAALTGARLAGLPCGLAARGDNLDPADPDLAAKLARAAFIRANNKADQERVAAFADAEAKTFMIYNSLTLPRDAPAANRFRSGTPRLLAVGRFDVTKGFDILLRACALLVRDGFDFRLTLAGGGGKVMGLGKLEDYLRDLRRELGLESYVDMPGLISHDELPALLATHDIFVAPCVIHSSGRRDGIPNTVIEAMAAGMPLIATNINALPEVARDGSTGFAVPPNDPQALANAIKRMASDPQKAIRMGENGAALAREMFDPDKNADQLAKLLIRTYQKSPREK